ncbi:MAG TPA: TraR/DksA C4-type zinc finger protein [Rhizomicrobium sp.]|jgi:phage/conjugal plasmid C-4 type zinc finger TraR family protein
MDQFDFAQQAEEDAREEALARLRIVLASKKGASREDCLDCDGEIPAARRLAVRGVERCVVCQSIFERAFAEKIGAKA